MLVKTPSIRLYTSFFLYFYYFITFYAIYVCPVLQQLSVQVISILFLTKISLVWYKTVVRDLHVVNRKKV